MWWYILFLFERFHHERLFWCRILAKDYIHLFCPFLLLPAEMYCNYRFKSQMYFILIVKTRPGCHFIVASLHWFVIPVMSCLWSIRTRMKRVLLYRAHFDSCVDVLIVFQFTEVSILILQYFVILTLLYLFAIRVLATCKIFPYYYLFTIKCDPFSLFNWRCNWSMICSYLFHINIHNKKATLSF